MFIAPRFSRRFAGSLFAAACLCALSAAAAEPPARVFAQANAAEAPADDVLPGAMFAQETTPIEPPELIPPRPSNEPPPSAPGTMAPSQNVTINLINRLVQRGALTAEDAAELINMAEQDAVIAQQQAAAAAQASVAAAPSVPVSDDDVRVTYVPETVKRQIREDIRQDVMEQARAENWANPRSFPTWVSRFKPLGDLRVRYEANLFPGGNDNTGAFPNFNSINTGAPFDIAGTLFSPQINVDEDRHRIRLRARFGMSVDLEDGFTSGIRIATGENNSPVSTNQSFGLANQGQGGNFSKYAIWLDRAFVKYELGDTNRNVGATIGRFESPFFATDIIWDDDLGFDGLALQSKFALAGGVTPFLNAGAFPVFNTDFNFSSNRPDKFPSDDKYLFGGQIGTDWRINKDLTVRAAVAYYHFQNVEGRLSDPFIPLTAQDAGNTDNSRPSFAQKGNTYWPLRDIIPDVTNNFGTTNQFQYFGLATSFHELAFTGRLDYSRFDPVHLALVSEIVTNLAFDSSEIDAVAVNNRGPNTAAGELGSFDGGDTAWMLSLRAGRPALEKRGDWNVSVGYRYVESDAGVDGLTDSDFGGGGTNLQGYTVGGALAISPRTWVALRWLSATSIGGPTYKNDILQFDFNAKF